MVYESNEINLIKLQDGTDGKPGKDGESGKTLYTWVKYSQYADGTDMTDDSTNAIYIGISYNNESPIELEDKTQYMWSKIKGDDGTKGDDGIGVSKIVEQYYLSSSNTTQIDGEWTTTSPNWKSGYYIWTRSEITWTDNSVTYTTAVLANALNDANSNASSALGVADNANTTANTANDKATFHYGTCSTAAATVEKVVTLSGFTLYTGANVTVYFTYANTASNPTLNVNGTGAKNIRVKNTNIDKAYYWGASDTVTFTYNGSYWVMSDTSANAIIASWCYNNDTTYINGGNIYARTVTAEKIATDAIKSTNYVAGTSGSFLNLADGTFESKYFKIGSDGSIIAAKGTIGTMQLTESGYLYNMQYSNPPESIDTIDTVPMGIKMEALYHKFSANIDDMTKWTRQNGGGFYAYQNHQIKAYEDPDTGSVIIDQDANYWRTDNLVSYNTLGIAAKRRFWETSTSTKPEYEVETNIIFNNTYNYDGCLEFTSSIRIESDYISLHNHDYSRGITIQNDYGAAMGRYDILISGNTNFSSNIILSNINNICVESGANISSFFASKSIESTVNTINSNLGKFALWGLSLGQLPSKTGVVHKTLLPTGYTHNNTFIVSVRILRDEGKYVYSGPTASMMCHIYMDSYDQINLVATEDGVTYCAGQPVSVILAKLI